MKREQNESSNRDSEDQDAAQNIDDYCIPKCRAEAIATNGAFSDKELAQPFFDAHI
jgi:hypothetical protein